MNNQIAASIETKKYLEYLDEWLSERPVLQFTSAEIQAQNTAVMVVDVTNGFSNQGALASSRVKAIVPSVTELVENAWKNGVRDIFLLNDLHEPDAVEFTAFLPHCVKGTDEPEPVDEIRALDGYDQFININKNSISSDLGTPLRDCLEKRPQLKNFIITGDCTDLCVYQLAMFLRLNANATQDAQRNIIVVMDGTATYDLGVDIAQHAGAVPHPGDLLHAVFLHHLFLNDVKVVKTVAF